MWIVQGSVYVINGEAVFFFFQMEISNHVKYPWIMMLTLNVRGPSYLRLTRSISWLLMPWLLTSPGHQQPRYWLYRIYVGPSLTWGRILSVKSMWRNDIKCKYMFMIPLKNLAHKGLMLENVRTETHWLRKMLLRTHPEILFCHVCSSIC